ncbi:MAG: M6 family metalloprotease domain-containing protein, partial [Sphingobacteriales bacterium]
AQGGDPVLAPTGSVKDLYAENSYGAMVLNSTIYGWVTLPHTEQYYANGESGLDATIQEAIIDALNLTDSLINYSQFDTDSNGFVDSITFVHSGYAAEFGGTDSSGVSYEDRIWSHRWQIPEWTSAEGVRVRDYHINPGLWGTSGSAPGRIGVISHETGHFFGLPDLYDTNDGGEGIGSYCMMANSWGFDGEQLNPPHFSAWSKIFLGWATPTLLTTAGNYSLPRVETTPSIFKITHGYPSGEYLLVENRQPFGFESVMPQGGLAVWHIDENKNDNTEEGYPGQGGWPGNNLHYKVALLQADGLFDLERGANRGDAGDVFHGAGVSEINQSTPTNTDAYQGGAIANTGNRIFAISGAGPTMT